MLTGFGSLIADPLPDACQNRTLLMSTKYGEIPMPNRSIHLALSFLLASVPCWSAETNTAPKFDGAQAKQWVAHLSTDALQGRMTCTEGYRKAADWSASRFKEWGAKPAGEEGPYFQKVSIPGFTCRTGVRH